jgi:hypothetical protein
MKYLKLIILLFSISIFVCCNKDEMNINTGIAKTEQDLKLESLAKAFAKTLTNNTNIAGLQEAVNIKFDGDYDLLFAKLVSDELKQGNILAQSLENNLEYDGIELIKEMPLLNISVPYINEKTNINTLSTSPWVVYVPSDFSEQKTKFVLGFNAKGTSKQFSVANAPDEAVVVIGQNERVIALPKGQKSTGKGLPIANINNSDFDYFNIAPIGDGTPGGGGGTGSGTTRVSGNMEYVKLIHFTDIQAVEAWVLGAPEIRLRVFAGASGSQLSSYYLNPSRNSCENTDLTVNIEVINWRWSDYGNYLLYDWREEDGGNAMTVGYSSPSSQYGSVSISFTMNEKDDEIGHFVINKEDVIDHKYNTGIMYWYENY